MQASKEQPAKKLSGRERVLIIVLVALVFVGAIGYFGIMPAMATMGELDAEVRDYEVKQSELLSEIRRGDTFRSSSATAEQEFEAYREFFYDQMSPETIDSLITKMFVEKGLTPTQLDIGAFVPENVTQFAPQPLVAPVISSKLPEHEDEGSTNPDAMAMPAQTNSATQDALVYSCTINIQAEGTKEMLMQVLEQTRDLIAMRVISYSWIDTDELNNTFTTGTVQMQLRIYILAGKGR
ncbi:MAG: hypothetical protein LBG97_02310 [Coriobacteriales bacterium]|jgi:hypothetical protein|nr:hypothetical protein [Coriobacteriales bacterium]